MCSARDNAALPTLGFPIRASAGQWLFSASPRLIAAVHALLRLLVPRHPPCALTILTVDRGESLAGFASEKLGKRLAAFTFRFLKGNRRQAITRYPFHWLLCSFQGPGRGAPHAHELTRTSTSAGGEPVSQN